MRLEDTELWEILLPYDNNMTAISPKDFRVTTKGSIAINDWYDTIKDNVTGITICSDHYGMWNQDAETCKIVRIACSQLTMEKIMKLTATIYDQECVMAYKVSSRCLMYYPEAPKIKT